MKEKDQTNQSFKNLVKLLPGRWLLISTISIILMEAALEIVFARSLRTIIDSSTKMDISLFGRSMVLALSSLLVILICIYGRKRFIGLYSEGGTAFLRLKAMEHINRLPIDKLEGNHSGDYISRLTNDISKIEVFANEKIFKFFYYPLIALLSLIYLIIISWKLTLLTFLMFPIMFIGISALSKPIGKYSKTIQEKLGMLNSINQDFISGAETAKAFNLKNSLMVKYQDSLNQWSKESRRLAVRSSLVNSFSSLLGLAPFFITFGAGGYWVIQGEMTIGGLLVFINLLNNLTNPISIMPKLLAELKSDMASGQRILDIFQMKPEAIEEGVFSPDCDGPVIEFNNVSYGYGDEKSGVINNLSFSLSPGEKVALVGPSGGGKSTLLKLLTGFYPGYQGEIKVFGHSLEEWNMASLRDNISLVSQDTYLFPKSLKENIAFGNLEASETDIIRAAKLAHAHDFISAFDRGYDTQAGELGGRLSGGQRQRISLARAILKDAPILLLDEATSALDNQSELFIERALDRFMVGKTSLIIAHRLSTIQNADRILVIDRGRVVEEGNHHQLMGKTEGLYRSLYQRQLEESA